MLTVTVIQGRSYSHREVFSFKNLNNVLSIQCLAMGFGTSFQRWAKIITTNNPNCLFSTGRAVTEDTHFAGQVFLNSLGLFCFSPMPALSNQFEQTSDGASVNDSLFQNTLRELQKLLKPKVNKGQSLDFQQVLIVQQLQINDYEPAFLC